MTPAALFVCCLLVAPPGAAARPELEEAHAHLVGLRFEKALAALERLLGSGELDPGLRGEALELRAEAHVATGDFNAAERDYRELLALEPAFVPDPSRTPRKGLERFAKAQAATVGRVILRLTPAEARIVVDGKPTLPGPGGDLPLVAGEHALRAELEGFDPGETSVVVEPGRARELVLRLVPNARSVILVTEPDGVDVRLDGQSIGRTAAASGSEGAAPVGELRLEHLPLGEHRFGFARDCYRTAQRTEFLTVDLTDASPLRYGPIRLVPVRSTLELQKGPEGAVVWLDGTEIGRLPLDPVERCPGSYQLDVRRAGRRIWSSRETLEPGGTTQIAIEPRPNAVLIGLVEPPPALARLSTAFSLAVVPQAPPNGTLERPEAWSRLGLGDEIDLGVGVEAGPGPSATERWYIWSPILRVVQPVDPATLDLERPSWLVPTWGLRTVDSKVGGSAVVGVVYERGAAALVGLQPGDTIAAVGGAVVTSTAQLRAILFAASTRTPLELEWREGRVGGATRRAGLRGSLSPRLDARPMTAAGAAVRAAWAATDGIGEDESAASARANLALLLGAFGDHERAAETWRRVGWQDRSGIGKGTELYYRGRELESAGRKKEAIEAYRQAAACTAATALDDEGPKIAPAARDRLWDLTAP